MRRQSVFVHSREKGRIAVPGYVEGCLAVHRSLCTGRILSDTTWTVTHIPSGASLCRGIWKLREAKDCLRQFLSVNLDWPTLTFTNRREYFAPYKETLISIRDEYGEE